MDETTTDTYSVAEFAKDVAVETAKTVAAHAAALVLLAGAGLAVNKVQKWKSAKAAAKETTPETQND